MKKIIACLFLIAALLMPLKAAMPTLRRHASDEECCGHCGQAHASNNSSKDSRTGTSGIQHCCSKMAAQATSQQSCTQTAMVVISKAPQKCGCQILPDDGAPLSESLRTGLQNTIRTASILPAIEFHGLIYTAECRIRPPPDSSLQPILHESIPTTILLN